jgi:hypothetical protein
VDDQIIELLAQGGYLSKELGDMVKNHPSLGVLPRQTCGTAVTWIRGTSTVIEAMAARITTLEGELYECSEGVA